MYYDKYVWQYFIMIQSNIEYNLLSKNFTNGVVFFSFNQQKLVRNGSKYIFVCVAVEKQ